MRKWANLFCPALTDSRCLGSALIVEPRIHDGYIYAAVMLVIKLIEALTQSWHSHLMTRAALRARTGIVAAIYRKCIWLSGVGGSGDQTTGAIQNLMANDAQFFIQVAPQINNIFVCEWGMLCRNIASVALAFPSPQPRSP